jgi:hypothetical protein
MDISKHFGIDSKMKVGIKVTTSERELSEIEAMSQSTSNKKRKNKRKMEESRYNSSLFSTTFFLFVGAAKLSRSRLLR